MLKNSKPGSSLLVIFVLVVISLSYFTIKQLYLKDLSKTGMTSNLVFAQEDPPEPPKSNVRKPILKSDPEPGLHKSWHPSEWGADDRRGAVNRLTPQKALEAASLIKTGKVYQLGRVYESGIPVFGTRHYSLRIPQMSGPLGDNKTTWFEEILVERLVRLERNSMDWDT